VPAPPGHDRDVPGRRSKRLAVRGILPANLTAIPAGTPGTSTVDDDPAPVLTDDSGVVCDNPGWYYFDASVEVWVVS